jgi:putative SOS response-associated peptidase YedK
LHRRVVLIMFTVMSATAFDTGAPLDRRRAIIRRDGDGVEMVELPWGLRPREPGGRPFTVIRAEGRTFPSHRCLVPASEFRHRSRGRRYTFSLADGDWFYFAGIWRPKSRDWPEAYAILTIEANADIAPYHDRQMAVLKRDQRLDWLDGTCADNEKLQPLPAGSFLVKQDRGAEALQGALAL